MKVKVVIEVSVPPTDDNLKALRSAASELTNTPNSIQVEVSEKEAPASENPSQRFLLTTTFSMRKAAQYKVVSQISQEFEFWTSSLVGYQDMAIAFL